MMSTNSHTSLNTRTLTQGTIAVFTLLTVLAGMLGPMQSAVNGQAGKRLGDGHLAAVVSFGTGLGAHADHRVVPPQDP
ncbi:DMT family transporter [Propionibacterium freudenreichii]|uniref:DMT family transporter n=1 Tax=Propionibacterium freudenreichii TaxID=1744 RepID=UPI0023EA5302|nr:DMT family transporter [Propionibacterium freudenreichii]